MGAGERWGPVDVSKSVRLLLEGRDVGPLEALALSLAARVDGCDSDRDLASLSRELRVVLAEIRAGDKPIEQGIDALIGALSKPVADG